jgi:hypothetical protein
MEKWLKKTKQNKFQYIVLKTKYLTNCTVYDYETKSVEPK